MKNARSSIKTILVTASVALLAACGGGGGGATAPVPSVNSTPAPIQTQAPNIGSKLNISPSSLAFTSQTPQTFVVTDPTFKGTYTVTGCGNVVSVSPQTASGPTATFTVTPLAGGACALTVTEGNSSGTGTLDVSATITQGTIQ